MNSKPKPLYPTKQCHYCYQTVTGKLGIDCVIGYNQTDVVQFYICWKCCKIRGFDLDQVDS